MNIDLKSDLEVLRKANEELAAAKRAIEERLREREEWVRALLGTAVDGIITVDGHGIVDSFNPAAERLFGYTADEVIGRNVSMLMPEPYRDEHDGYLARYQATHEPHIIGIGREVRGRRKDGSTFPLYLGVGEHRGGAEERYTGILHDLTEEKRIQAALDEANRTFNNLLSNVPGMAYRCLNTPDWDVEFVSEGCRELTGYAPRELEGVGSVKFGELIHPDDRERVWHDVQAAIAAKTHYELSYRIRTAEGEQKWVWEQGCGVFDPSGELRWLEGLVTDVSERKRLEREFLQAQKLEAVGRLAGGIAHDFNNLLAGMIGCCRRVQGRLEAGQSANRELRELIDAAERGAGLTRQLLSFSRKRDDVLQSVQLNAAVESAEPMIRYLVGEDIELDVELDDSLPPIVADPTHLEQVVLNIVVNARDAMPDGGRIVIRTERLSPPSGTAAGDDECHCRLSIRDSGIGMDEATVERAFEPFFSTKGESQGTGLGLSTVYGIVKQLDGAIEIESEVGKGTTLTLDFPCRGAAHSPGPEDADEPSSGGAGGGARVLLVEDDTLVRAGVRHQLGSLGYEVLDARSPVEALRSFEESGERIDLVLTDLVMPEMSGTELVAELLARDPGLAVVYMSAYPADALVEQGRLPPGSLSLEKPFTDRAVQEAIEEALVGRPLS